MARNDDAQHHHQHDEEMGSAGRPTGLDEHEPSATGTAGVYATPIHEEGEEAAAEGEKQAGSRTTR
ncbi:MAG: hypothetical protein IT306_03035 [Chloroflexi bacterium]|nr:hypothetical protein [Chloroflexota bacterium]